MRFFPTIFLKFSVATFSTLLHLDLLGIGRIVEMVGTDTRSCLFVCSHRDEKFSHIRNEFFLLRSSWTGSRFLLGLGTLLLLFIWMHLSWDGKWFKNWPFYACNRTNGVWFFHGESWLTRERYILIYGTGSGVRVVRSQIVAEVLIDYVILNCDYAEWRWLDREHGNQISGKANGCAVYLTGTVLRWNRDGALNSQPLVLCSICGC